MKEVISKVKALARNQTARGTAVVTAGILLGTFFSYLLQVGLGRLLSIEDFGTFNALLSLSTVLWVPASAISVALIKKVSELLAQKDFYTLKNLFWSFSKTSLAAGTMLSVIFILLHKPVAAYFNISQVQTVFAFSAFLTVSFVSMAPQSYLQGLLRFKAFSFFTAISQLLRLVVPILMVYAGFAVSGVYLGLAVVAVLSYTTSLPLLHKNLREGIAPTARSIKPNVEEVHKQILRFSTPVLLISLGTSLLNNADVVLAKHFLSPFDAGIYAGVVTMSKVFLFGAGIVQTVMFPQVAHLFVTKGDYTTRFKYFLFLQILLIVVGVVCYILFPVLINNILFSGKFYHSVKYLPIFSLFTAMYVLISFLSTFLLAINKTKAYLVILPMCAIQYLAINVYHGSISAFINVNIVATALACFSIALYVVKSLHEGVGNHTHLYAGKDH